MTTALFKITVVALAAALSACAESASPRLAAATPGPHPHVGAVHTLQDCGNDDGGFGAPVRHFGNPTPFSENPFNWCWPQ
jgi:hypothetical protein